MMAAWALHSHSLRQNELYIVLEQGVSLLNFIYAAAQDFGIPATLQAKRYERSMKKKFERRLRERHRLVHAHERPSLVSRIIDMTLGDISAEKITPTLIEITAKAAQMWPGKEVKDSTDLIQRIEEIKAQYGLIADRESRDMFEILREHIVNTINRVT